MAAVNAPAVAAGERKAEIYTHTVRAREAGGQGGMKGGDAAAGEAGAASEARSTGAASARPCAGRRVGRGGDACMRITLTAAARQAQATAEGEERAPPPPTPRPPRACREIAGGGGEHTRSGQVVGLEWDGGEEGWGRKEARAERAGLRGSVLTRATPPPPPPPPPW